MDGEIQENDGHRHTLALATAQNELLAFSRLLDVSFPGPQTTILDQGMVQVDGLEQINLLLGHVSIQTTECYLGSIQELQTAVNGHLGIE